MRIALITNLNSRGLVKDCDIITAAAPEHDYVRWQWTDSQDEEVDLNIHLEVIGTKVLANAKQNWLIPNLEFLDEITLSIACSTCIDLLLCKTNDAYVVLKDSRKEKDSQKKTLYLGFMSTDVCIPTIKKEVFLHVAGKSQHRNTRAVLDAWRDYTITYPLIVVSQYFKEEIPNVTFLKDVEEEELIHLMNECKYHILPSEYEGFGHAIHEAMLVGAKILTTDRKEPGEKHLGQYNIPGVSSRQQGQANLVRVSSSDVAQMVDIMVKNPMPSLRPRALKEAREFKKRLKELLKAALEIEAELGTKPSPTHSLDRYPDNDGHYEKGNVRWATPSEQQKNRRAFPIGVPKKDHQCA